MTYGDGETLPVPGAPRVVFFPGHTDGHCAFTCLSATSCSRATRSSLASPTGGFGPQIVSGAATKDTKLALASLSRIEELDAQTLLPGHGEPWTNGTREAVRAARAAGAS